MTVDASLFVDPAPKGVRAELSRESAGTAFGVCTNEKALIAIITTSKIFSRCSNFFDSTVVLRKGAYTLTYGLADPCSSIAARP